jgi:hypothetical protein
MQNPDIPILQQAAEESLVALDRIRDVLSALEIPRNERNGTAIALLYSAAEQAHSAAFLVARDIKRGVLPALILIRSQLDHLMRAAFFARAATAEQLEHFLENDELPRHKGRKLGPRELARINADAFEWQPRERVPNLVADAWGVLCGFSHGGRALLNYFVGPDGVGHAPPAKEFIHTLRNSVALAQLGLAIAIELSRNFSEEHVQQAMLRHLGVQSDYDMRWNKSVSSS